MSRSVGTTGLDMESMGVTQRHLDTLTKPRGSLGRLEEVVVQLAGMTGHCPPVLDRRVVVVMAADHGIAAEGVSAYPQEVTAQMVSNFASGGAAVNVLARRRGTDLLVVDMGVATEPADHPALLKRRIAAGTASFLRGPAMTKDQAEASIEVGLQLARDQVAAGVQLVVGGEMGIGNTTAASALVAALLGRDPDDVTGAGTGLDAKGRRRKVALIRKGLSRRKPGTSDPVGVLADVGGFEIGGLAGLMIGCAEGRVPFLLDGFICGAAALLATRICPEVRHHLLAAHLSSEPGHRLVLRDLGLNPLLELDMRLGEASGALVALGLIDDALALCHEMATFEEAGVSR